MPAGFADGVDNNTIYSAGNGLSLVGTEYTAELLIEGGAASLSSPDVNTSVGTPYYTGDYDLLFVGDTGWGDPNSCSGSIERIIVEPLP